MTISLATRFKKVKLFFHFTFFEWAFININVKEIISTLIDFLKDRYHFDNFIAFAYFNDNFLIILRLI